MVEVLLKKAGPVVQANFIAAVAGLWAVHQNVLQAWGLTYGIWPIDWGNSPPTGRVIVLELDTLSSVAWANILTFGVPLVIIVWHHFQAFVKKTPQTGAMRSTDLRKTDLQPEEPASPPPIEGPPAA